MRPSFEKRVADAKREIRARSIDGVERLTLPATVESRELPSGAWRIIGHGIVYNSLSEDLGGFREQIKPGAATKILASMPDVRGLFNHDPNLVLGRTTNGTMRLDDSTHGLAYTITPPDTSYANDLRVLLARGDITQSSFAFRVGSGGSTWEEDPESDGLIRTVHEFSGLYDMSPVTYPAYTLTDAGASSSAPGERSPVASAQRQDEMALGADERTSDGDVLPMRAALQRSIDRWAHLIER